MLNSDCTDKEAHYPEKSIENYNLKVIMCWQKENENNFAQMQTLHREIFTCLCSIYQYICPTPEGVQSCTYMVLGSASNSLFRENYAASVAASATSGRSRL